MAKGIVELTGHVVAVVLVGLLSCQVANAFVVDSTADGADANPGDAICATLASACTLRAAIEEANALPGLDFVQLDDVIYTRTINAALEITDAVQIFHPSGFVATIDAAELGAGLHVHPGVSVTLHRVHVTHGNPGIINEGDLHLDQVALTENTGSSGAAIYNTGSLDSDRAYINYNGPGSAIFNQNSVSLTRGAVSLNDGVGIENRFGGGGASLDLVTVDANGGGGIFNAYQASLEIRRSSLADNGGYGAVFNEGSAALRRSTVSGNHGTYASAIYTSGAMLALEDTTIAANGTANSPLAALDGSVTAVVRAINSIVGGNFGSTGDPDCRVTVTSLGHNLMSCALQAADPTTFAADPRVAPLKTFQILNAPLGDSLRMHGLLPDSPALNAGACASGFPDQRGMGRPEEGACDIGAFERQALCVGGVGMEDARIAFRRQADGTTTVKVRSLLSFANPLSPVIDPVNEGLQLRIEDTSGGASLEHTAITNPIFGLWTGTSRRFRSRDTRTPLLLTLKDRRTSNAGVVFRATTKAVLPPVTGPVRITVVAGGGRFGEDVGASNSGACAVQVLNCTGGPSKVTCE